MGASPSNPKVNIMYGKNLKVGKFHINDKLAKRIQKEALEKRAKGNRRKGERHYGHR